LAAGIRNLDEAPPFSNQESTFQLAYNPQVASPLGRVFYLRAVWSFRQFGRPQSWTGAMRQPVHSVPDRLDASLINEYPPLPENASVRGRATLTGEA